ncbi:hypothetical protein B0H11DRAFT_1020460 [Mycena galericulata]|nr:hypothetical protein B0H11DRAFT_1020460 [Mycena galericulata]
MSTWPCSECSKSFSRKGDLTRHSFLHTGYKPYTCSECDKTFAQHSGLKTHMNVHTRVKPFRCGINACKAAFGDPSSCARHRKETHRLAGAYRCPESRCKSSIKRRSAFTAHLRKHGMKYTGIDIEDFYSAAAHNPRPPVSQNAHPDADHSMDMVFAHREPTTYDAYPIYQSYAPEGMLSFSNDYANDADLRIATGDLFTFDSRSSSLAPPSLAASLSLSASPSPSPLESQDDRSMITLPHVNIAAANTTPDSGMSGASPVLSPVSQLMFVYGYDVSEFNKLPMDWA